MGFELMPAPTLRQSLNAVLDAHYSYTSPDKGASMHSAIV